MLTVGIVGIGNAGSQVAALAKERLAIEEKSFTVVNIFLFKPFENTIFDGSLNKTL